MSTPGTNRFENNGRNYKVTLGRDTPSLSSGPHFASYGAICPVCNARYGKPSAELKVEPCSRKRCQIRARSIL